MKRYALFLAVLLVAVLAFNSCGKKENPYEPNTDAAMGSVAANLINSGAVNVTPGLGVALFDLNTDSLGIQAQIIITFPVNMNAGTVNLTNIEVDAIQGGTITYYPELRKAVIYGTWTAGAYWVKVVFKTGLQGQGGGYIDGNGNGKADGAPYDYKKYYVCVGAPVTPAPDFVHPALINGFPYGGGVNPIHPGFYCTFDNNDIDSNLVRANFSVRDSTGRSISLKSAGTAGGPGSWFVLFQTTGADSILTSNAPYTVNVNLNAISDTNGNKAVWSNYGYVANIANAVWPFRTSTTAAGDYTPVRYITYSKTATELIVTFNDTLNYTTINANTFKVYKTSGGNLSSAVYGRIYYQPSDVGAYQVRFTLENAPIADPPNSTNYRFYLSRNIRDNTGWYLDGNNNGIGGEAGVPGWYISSDDIDEGFTR